VARKKKNETNLVSNPESQVQAASVEVQPLTDDERARLSKWEAIFQKLEEIVDDAVTGLIDIRDNRLYRETHDTFEAYCSEKLHTTRRQADRLIAAFPINKALADAGLPKLSEGAAREVADLPPADAVKVVQAAKDENPDGKLTAEKVKQARERVAPKKKSHRVRGKLNEQDAQELLSQGNMVKVGDQYYSKGTPEYEAEMARRATPVAKELAEKPVDVYALKKQAIEIIQQAQRKTKDKKKSGFWLDDLGENLILDRSLELLVQYMQGTIEREEYVRGVRAEPPPSEPEPRHPYTDDEILGSFCSWFGEWVDGLRQDDESCTEERVIKPILHHLHQVYTEVKETLRKEEAEKLVNEACA
jgi:hypothetical protein